jgi:hypothetical protein
MRSIVVVGLLACALAHEAAAFAFFPSLRREILKSVFQCFAMGYYVRCARALTFENLA